MSDDSLEEINPHDAKQRKFPILINKIVLILSNETIQLQRFPLFCANIFKKDPGRAKQNSLATAGTNFTKPGAQNKGDLCITLLHRLSSLGRRMPPSTSMSLLASDSPNQLTARVSLRRAERQRRNRRGKRRCFRGRHLHLRCAIGSPVKCTCTVNSL